VVEATQPQFLEPRDLTPGRHSGTTLHDPDSHPLDETGGLSSRTPVDVAKILRT